MKYLALVLVLALLTPAVWAKPLRQAYEEAGPGEGYDKLLVLDPNIKYTGGCGVLIGKTSCIRGNGALIDLDGENVQAGGSGTQLTISGCCLVNGGYFGAVNVQDGANAVINGNTFCKNNGLAAIRVWEYSTATIKNNVIWGNTTYGIAKHEYTGTLQILYNDADNNPGGNYMYFCPG
ncbi:MAG: right-handed parallel beta-helix repeat-containing protein [Candidatus Coatesbacteria bacterium]|nr:MAG: right-handed parallel beta-helix repeat-containing protein [Candidatus Coatesbacteria bacterium]